MCYNVEFLHPWTKPIGSRLFTHSALQNFLSDIDFLLSPSNYIISRIVWYEVTHSNISRILLLVRYTATSKPDEMCSLQTYPFFILPVIIFLPE